MIVALRALGLGDFLTAVPALRALAAAFPDQERVLAAPMALAPLVNLLGPAIDRVVDTGELEPLHPELRGADIAVNLHGCGPESHRLMLDTRPRRLIAFRHRDLPQTSHLPEWRAHEHEVHRWCRLLDQCGISADPRKLELQRPAVEPPDRVRGATLIHPGAASAARRWPAERWAEVARAEQERGVAVFITGGPGEIQLAAGVARLGGLRQTAVLAGRTDLLRLAALVAAAGCVACGDTGIAHLATAFGTPSVVLFGPTPPQEWGPPPAAQLHRALWAGRCGDPQGCSVDPGLLDITPTLVVQALRSLPASSQ